MIVPRLVTHNGKPQGSYCPFCGAEVRSFESGFAKCVELVNAECAKINYGDIPIEAVEYQTLEQSRR